MTGQARPGQARPGQARPGQDGITNIVDLSGTAWDKQGGVDVWYKDDVKS